MSEWQVRGTVESEWWMEGGSRAFAVKRVGRIRREYRTRRHLRAKASASSGCLSAYVFAGLMTSGMGLPCTWLAARLGRGNGRKEGCFYELFRKNMSALSARKRFFVRSWGRIVAFRACCQIDSVGPKGSAGQGERRKLRRRGRSWSRAMGTWRRQEYSGPDVAEQCPVSEKM